MLSRRTKILIALAALAPASIVITRLHLAAISSEAREKGDLGAWVDPGPLSYFLLLVGLGCFIAAIISAATDMRNHK